MTRVLLLHGVGLDHRMWRRCRQPLQAHLPVEAPDLPGHGTAPPVPPSWRLRELATAIIGDRCEAVHLVGFSLGALVAQRVALDRPDLVRSLTLVSSVANRSHDQAAAVAERLATAEHDVETAAERAVERWMGAAWRAAEPELARELLATLRAQHQPSYRQCYRIFAEADQELWPLLSAITAPTLAITGANDPGSTPEMSQQLAGHIPCARAEIVPNVRHLVPLEAPTQLGHAILRHIQEVEHDNTTEA